MKTMLRTKAFPKEKNKTKNFSWQEGNHIAYFGNTISSVKANLSYAGNNK